jgi:glycine cleavage system H lipoate-binding protein
MQPIQLSIPEPCHENWDSMSLSEKGRFCGSCQKEVVDFTGMTDAELFAFFAQPRTGSVCGRTHIGQLDTPIAQPIPIKKHRLWYLQYAASLLLLLAKPGSGKAQDKPPVTVAPQSHASDILMGDTLIVEKPQPVERVLEGKVMDEEGIPVPGASILINNSRRGVATDNKGHYRIKVKEGDLLLISSVGFIQQEVPITQLTHQLTVLLKAARHQLMGAVVITAVSTDGNSWPVAYDVARHKVLLQVKDQQSQAPIAGATVATIQYSAGTPRLTTTNPTGAGWLRKIKDDQTYTVVITAMGYHSKSITLKGDQLHNGNNKQTILLDKAPVVQTMEEVVVMGIKPTVKQDAQKHTATNEFAGKMSRPIVAQTLPTDLKLQLPSNELNNLILPPPVVGGGECFIRLGFITATPPTNNVLVGKTVPTVDKTLQGKIGGIVAGRAIPAKRKTGFFKKIFSNPGAGTTKAAATKTAANTPTLIHIYPNPATTHGTITIAFEKAPKGSYRLQLVDMAGRQLQQAMISVPEGAFHFQWALESQVVAGSYVVNVIDREGKAILTNKIIITQ